MYAFAHFVDERYALHAFRHLVQFCLDLGLRGLCCMLIFGGIVDSGANIFHVVECVGTFGLDGCVCCLTQIVNGGLEFVGFAEDVRIVRQLFRRLVQAVRSAGGIVDVRLVVLQLHAAEQIARLFARRAAIAEGEATMAAHLIGVFADLTIAIGVGVALGLLLRWGKGRASAPWTPRGR